MTNEERAWWSPEALVEREREVRSGTSEDAEDVRNDFASYRALLGGRDVEDSGLHLHNEVEPWRVDTVCREYQAIVQRVLGRTPHSVADLGCGAGFTTDGMHRRWPNAVVRGFDVSHDAVQFARHRWKGCRFVDGAIVPGTRLEGAPYDFILCQEFYPFTRTDVVESHREWMRLLIDNLNNGGLAIIMVTASTAESINHTYEELRSEFRLQRIRIGAPKVSRRLSFQLTRLAGELLRGVKPIWVRNLYVLQRQ